MRRKAHHQKDREPVSRFPAQIINYATDLFNLFLFSFSISNASDNDTAGCEHHNKPQSEIHAVAGFWNSSRRRIQRFLAAAIRFVRAVVTRFLCAVIARFAVGWILDVLIYDGIIRKLICLKDQRIFCFIENRRQELHLTFVIHYNIEGPCHGFVFI